MSISYDDIQAAVTLGFAALFGGLGLIRPFNKLWSDQIWRAALFGLAAALGYLFLRSSGVLEALLPSGGGDAGGADNGASLNLITIVLTVLTAVVFLFVGEARRDIREARDEARAEIDRFTEQTGLYNAVRAGFDRVDSRAALAQTQSALTRRQADFLLARNRLALSEHPKDEERAAENLRRADVLRAEVEAIDMVVREVGQPELCKSAERWPVDRALINRFEQSVDAGHMDDWRLVCAYGLGDYLDGLAARVGNQDRAFARRVEALRRRGN